MIIVCVFFFSSFRDPNFFFSSKSLAICSVATLKFEFK